MSPWAYPWDGPSIDWPQRFGDGGSVRLEAGQSFLEVGGWRGARIGISSENVWWDGSRRYPLLLGPSASGAEHVYLGLPRVTALGWDARIDASWARLVESPYLDDDPDTDRNLLGALRLELLHRQSGARIALTSLVRQEWTDSLPVAALLDLVQVDHLQSQRDLKGIDRIAGVSGRFPIPSADVVLYGTWGRGDGFLDTEDLLTEHDHNSFWTAGIMWEWGPHGQRWRFTGEHGNTAASSDQFGLRGQSRTVYRHVGNRQGHSNEGQPLGSSIGPGSLATFLLAERILPWGAAGLYFERVEWDRDTHLRSLRAVYGRDSQDEEWLLGLRGSGSIPERGITIRLEGGIARRANRQYVRFTGRHRDALPRIEHNVWLDVSLVWDLAGY